MLSLNRWVYISRRNSAGRSRKDSVWLGGAGSAIMMGGAVLFFPTLSYLDIHLRLGSDRGNSEDGSL